MVPRGAHELGARVEQAAEALGARIRLDVQRVLTEREQLSVVRHHIVPGRSLRGGTHLHRTADGWAAINLARPEDGDTLPAFTEGVSDERAHGLDVWFAQTSGEAIRERAALLGLAVGVLPGTDVSPKDAWTHSPTETFDRRPLGLLHVVDLSRLWAGPLAGALLGRAGMRVTRAVDARSTPRVAPSDVRFDRRLHDTKKTIRIDYSDRRAMHELLAGADVVITSMRPSALERFPVPRPDALHLAITAHGLQSDRVGFGDDCAVEGGLVDMRTGDPAFVGDAIADPLTGLVAAWACLHAIGNGAAGRVDVSLVRSAAWVAAREAPA